MQTWSGGSTHITMPNFLETGLSKADILRFFKFSKCLLPPLSDFWNCKILLAIWVERIETHQHAKFRQNRSISCEDIKIFRFFKMAAAAILDVRIRKFFGLTVSGGHKIGQNWSFNCGDREFSNFQNGRRHLGFLKLRDFFCLFGWRKSRRISTPNFAKIGQSVVKALRCFVFSRWQPPPSWIVKFAKF